MDCEDSAERLAPIEMGPCAFAATVILTKIWVEDPAARAAFVVQEAVGTEQVQGEPALRALNVRPDGTVTVTVIAPEVGPAPEALAMVIV